MICCLNFSFGQTYLENPTLVENSYVFTVAEFDKLMEKITINLLQQDSLITALTACNQLLLTTDSLVVVQDSLITTYDDYKKPW